MHSGSSVFEGQKKREKVSKIQNGQYLFRNPFAQPRQFDALLGVQLCQAHLQHLKIKCISSLARIKRVCAQWVQNLSQSWVCTAPDRGFRIICRRIHRPQANVSWVGFQIRPNPFRQSVVSSLCIEHKVKRLVLLLVAPGRVRVEPYGSLVLQEVIVFSSILEPIRRRTCSAKVGQYQDKWENSYA